MAHTFSAEERKKAQAILTEAASKMKAAISSLRAMGYDVNYRPICRQINSQFSIVSSQQHKGQQGVETTG